MSDQNPPRKRFGCWFYGCVGLIVFVLVGALLLFLGGRYAFRQLERVALQHTDTQPIPIERVEVPPAELEAIQARMRTFHEALTAGKESKELVLTAHDINALIAGSPDFQEFRDKIFVMLEGDKAKARVSWPLRDLGPFKLKGRYLNATVAFKFEFQDGVLRLFLDDVQVKGAPLPPAILTRFRSENLAKDWQNNPQHATELQKYESIRLQDDKLILKNKAQP